MFVAIATACRIASDTEEDPFLASPTPATSAAPAIIYASGIEDADATP